MADALLDTLRGIGRRMSNSTRLINYYWQRTKRNKLAVFGLAFIIFLTALAAFGPFFTADPTAVNFEEKEIPPVGFTSQRSIYNIQSDTFTTTEIHGTWKHPLGTDSKGRDMLAMIVSGARVSLLVGLIATGIAIVLGTIIGVLAAYLGGWADNALMRFTDIMMTFPFFLLLVLIVFIFGPNLAFIVLAIGLTGWTGTARLIRSESLSLRTREFIVASKALGASDNRVIFRHLIPNVISLIIIIATLSIPGVILAEAALSFIGLGDPSVPSWGIILESGQHTLDTAWWVAVEPGIMLFLTVLAFNFLGDGLRDAFDPKSNV
jgi:peptide/nickel transport system permease protein